MIDWSKVRYSKDGCDCSKFIKKLQAENSKLKECVKFYADPRWWDYRLGDIEEVKSDGGFINREYGKRARQALKELEEK